NFTTNFLKRTILIYDRVGILIREPVTTYQVNTLEEIQLLPEVIGTLKLLCLGGYELVMVSNQDGLGTDAYPEENFLRVQKKLLEIFEGENIRFSAVHIDRSFAHEKKDTRKPGIGMLTAYLGSEVDMEHSFVIGDRLTDEELAVN